MSSIYFPPSLKHFEPRRIIFSTWIDHLAFGYDIVEAVRPKILVELGSHNGLSYFAFCQSIVDHDIDGLTYAVDNWEGEEHAGFHDQSVYNDVMQHNRDHYRGFSYPLKMMFNDALAHFEDQSIDLLHIDGLHTYEAVKEDFNNWYPKVAPGGIMLFHDTAARIKDFAVWKFWDEISTEYNSFSFHHGFGLGVLRKPGGEPSDHPLLNLLFDSNKNEQADLRKFYCHASEVLELKRKVKRFTMKQANNKTQIPKG